MVLKEGGLVGFTEKIKKVKKNQTSCPVNEEILVSNACNHDDDNNANIFAKDTNIYDDDDDDDANCQYIGQ